MLFLVYLGFFTQFLPYWTIHYVEEMNFSHRIMCFKFQKNTKIEFSQKGLAEFFYFLVFLVTHMGY